MDRNEKLLMLAAKAEGRDAPIDSNGVFNASVGSAEQGHWWNPLEDDGDAMRLAVRLKLDINFFQGFEEVCAQGDGAPDTPETLGYAIEANEPFGEDILAATRRAIVRAAAEIGKSL